MKSTAQGHRLLGICTRGRDRRTRRGRRIPSESSRPPDQLLSAACACDTLKRRATVKMAEVTTRMTAAERKRERCTERVQTRWDA
eukprot:6210431-Pleurochrysis_carterae.AAC.1